MIGLEVTGLEMIWLDVIRLDMIGLEMIRLEMIGLEVIVNQIFSLLMKISVHNNIIYTHTTIHRCTVWKTTPITKCFT